MRHFSCRWYRPPEVDLNEYPRICNPYCRDIQIRRCQWTQGKKMTQSKSPIKNSNYFTCMQHFSCRWYRPPEVYLNGYPRICNHIAAIFKFGGVGGPRVTKWPREREWGRGLGRKMGQGGRGNGVGWGLGLRGAKGLGHGGDSDITQKYS